MHTMSFSIKRVALIAVAIVGVLAAQSATAMANVAPANTRISATSTDTVLVYSGIRIRCTTADATTTTPATGVSAISAVLTFGSGGRCDANGVTATVTCNRTVDTTLRLTAFAAPSGSGTIALDAAFTCTINVALAGCRVSVVGAQANVGTWSFTNRTQVLDIRANRVAATDTGGTCSGDTTARTRSGTASFTGTYTPDHRVTVS